MTTMTTMRRAAWMGSAAAVVMLGVTPSVMAHAGHETADTLASSFAAGLMHPVLGLDHLLAMVASGLIAVRAASRRALWTVPASFAGLMIVGGLLALAGMALPVAEWGIALSVIVFGVVVAAFPGGARVPAWSAAAVVALFAVCHGYAHVAELGAHAATPYMAGFVGGTLALHALAIAAGVGLSAAGRMTAVRVAGGAIAACFALMLMLGA